jgi:serine/threonine protein phosphatase PrpC
MKLVAAGLTDVGRERDHNEDSFLVNEELGLFLVADGMGGHRAGEVASAIARDTIADAVRTSQAPSRLQALDAAIRLANSRVVQEGLQNRTRKGLGTTIVALVRDGDAMGVAHAGDSRCYLYRGGQLQRMTRDHSLIEELGGDDPAVHAALVSYSNVITRALGTAVDTVPELRREPLMAGDLYVLCSDGLTGVVDDASIQRIISQQPDLALATRQLVDTANERGGPDNISVVLVRVEE